MFEEFGVHARFEPGPVVRREQLAELQGGFGEALGVERAQLELALAQAREAALAREPDAVVQRL